MLTRSKAGNRVVCGRVLALNITGVKHLFFVVNYLGFLQEYFPPAFLTVQDIIGPALIEQ
jgi:hypothetical protein